MSESSRLHVKGGVVNPVDTQDNAPPEAGRSAADQKQTDEILDPPDAPKRPPPGTGGGDGAPMG